MCVFEKNSEPDRDNMQVVHNVNVSYSVLMNIFLINKETKTILDNSNFVLLGMLRVILLVVDYNQSILRNLF